MNSEFDQQSSGGRCSFYRLWIAVAVLLGAALGVWTAGGQHLGGRTSPRENVKHDETEFAQPAPRLIRDEVGPIFTDDFPLFSHTFRVVNSTPRVVRILSVRPT
jgi:hypothetical protein